jgi:RNA 2',3'-cyclic 3'-phosphodiesterase
MRNAKPPWDNDYMLRLPREPAPLPPPALVAPATNDPGTAAGDRSSATGEAMRLFVAISPPPEVLDELAALIAPLRTARSDLRWTSREAWHVTLAFLGEVHESALPDLLPRLECAARRQHDICLSVSGAGAFPEAGRANVLWSGLSGDDSALADLAALVASGASLAGATPPAKGRTFKPHLTLARCRLPADVTEIVAMLAGYRGPAWHADRFHLVTSRLTPGTQSGRTPPQYGHTPAQYGRTPTQTGHGATPPRYTSIAWWPLSGPEPPANAAVRRTG